MSRIKLGVECSICGRLYSGTYYSYDEHPNLQPCTCKPVNQSTATRDSHYLLQSVHDAAQEIIVNRMTAPILGMEFVKVPAGVFEMGNVWGDLDFTTEPVHRVEIRAFQLGKYPVTQAQWLAVMGGENPAASFGKGFIDPKKPVINVSWYEVQEFIERLNLETNNHYRYRLPSEAEWEYAARSCGGPDKWSGTSSELRLNEYAHYGQDNQDRSNWATLRVGKKRPNELGLYDMSGNVWEWCQDAFYHNYDDAPADGTALRIGDNHPFCVFRGGGWRSEGLHCRCAFRGFVSRGTHLFTLGFRLAKDSR